MVIFFPRPTEESADDANSDEPEAEENEKADLKDEVSVLFCSRNDRRKRHPAED